MGTCIGQWTYALISLWRVEMINALLTSTHAPRAEGHRSLYLFAIDNESQRSFKERLMTQVAILLIPRTVLQITAKVFDETRVDGMVYETPSRVGTPCSGVQQAFRPSVVCLAEAKVGGASS
jgi:hypothetical protein